MERGLAAPPQTPPPPPLAFGFNLPGPFGPQAAAFRALRWLPRLCPGNTRLEISQC